MTLKDLTELRFKADRKKYPSVPVHAQTRIKYSDKTANGLAKCIDAFCALHDIMCMRTGNEGRYRAGETGVDVIGRTRIMKGTWIPGQNNGMADMTLVIKGKIYSVEIKIGKDRQSDVQKDFEARITKSGGVYVIVRSWEDFYNQYRTWKN